MIFIFLLSNLQTAINVTFLYFILYHKLIRKKEDAIIVKIILQQNHKKFTRLETPQLNILAWSTVLLLQYISHAGLHFVLGKPLGYSTVLLSQCTLYSGLDRPSGTTPLVPQYHTFSPRFIISLSN